MINYYQVRNVEKVQFRQANWTFYILEESENMGQLQKNPRKERAATLSIFSNSFLVVGKIVVGVLTGSVGIISEAIHSAIDLVASGIAWWSVREAAKPPDSEHTYGHGKVETVSAFFESLLIVLAAVWILWEAGQKIFSPSPIEGISWGLGMMGFSGMLNFVVARYLLRVGEETDSPALIADAHHLYADVWSSLGIFTSLGLIALTGWHWIDPVVAILVGLWIFRTGLKLSRRGVDDLIDTALPAAEEKKIREILDSDSRIYTYHHFRSRKYGAVRMVDLHIHLDRNLSLAVAHGIAHEIEGKIKESIPNLDMVIHIEPCHEEASV